MSEETYAEKLAKLSPKTRNAMLDPREISREEFQSHITCNRFLVSGTDDVITNDDGTTTYKFIGLLDTHERVFCHWTERKENVRPN